MCSRATTARTSPSLWHVGRCSISAGRLDLLQAFVLDALKVLDRVEKAMTVTRYALDELSASWRALTLVLCWAPTLLAALHAPVLLQRLIRARQTRLVRIEGGMVLLPDQMPALPRRSMPFSEEAGVGNVADSGT
ncbi:MAG: hypothetical protein U1F67_23495 [Rubrivivax sp.]